MVSETTIILRIALAIVLCGLIGLERKHYHKPAGFRTNVMVGLGSTIIALTALSIYYHFNVNNNIDIGRIIGQIVTGIGFLGAGAIIRAPGSVHGLTTAASIWVVAAIGMTVGLGFYFIAIIGTLGSLIVLVFLGRIEHKFEDKITEHGEKDEKDEKKSII